MKALDMVERAISEEGITEYPPNSNNVKYNEWYYGHPVSGNAYPWCCAFISWLFRETKLVKKTASCDTMLKVFEKSGQVIPRQDARAGDLIFFKFFSNTKRVNHIGIITAYDKGIFYTVEGNTSVTSNDNGGSVMRRVRASNIYAIARPMYDDAWILVKKGSKGEFVKKLQRLLNANGSHLKVDGDFGVLTENAVIEYQASHDLVKDGVAGVKTWGKLIK